MRLLDSGLAINKGDSALNEQSDTFIGDGAFAQHTRGGRGART